ncbi:hypothetical protein B0T25DRAFT_515990 [Lasiosphaeria hispida]|uniref:Kinesin light chain n=1 Tax=Lasiosphaeria hispida TaxID=260671 RepID=A0AAJ0HJZ1_9PEZI|nr:hypothetical protein B0T25DRAFT_515990 [Lasiosphaeria hispida]
MGHDSAMAERPLAGVVRDGTCFGSLARKTFLPSGSVKARVARLEEFDIRPKDLRGRGYDGSAAPARERMEDVGARGPHQDPDTLASMNNVATVLKSQGKHEEAEQMYRQGLQLSEKVLGKEHPATLFSKNKLAAPSGTALRNAGGVANQKKTGRLRYG